MLDFVKNTFTYWDYISSQQCLSSFHRTHPMVMMYIQYLATRVKGQVIIFRRHINMEGKSSTQHQRFFYVYLPIDNVRCRKWPIFGGSKFENFSSSNYKKFAGESDWNREFLNYVRNLGFFDWKNDRFFFSKKLEFSKSVKVAILL